MRNYFFLFVCLLLLVACKTDNKSNTFLSDKNTRQAGFEIDGSFDTYLCDTVFLNAIHNNLIIPVDSSAVIDNNFTFKGVISQPERYALSFQNYSQRLILIVENQKIQIEIKTKELQDPIISGSPLNTLLNTYKNNSKSLFKEIDNLYPYFQKARLENDAVKLTEIREEMQEIDQKFINYTYSFILENKSSYVSGMILRDQLKRTPVDTLRISSTYKELAEKVKESADGQLIEAFLQLH